VDPGPKMKYFYETLSSFSLTIVNIFVRIGKI
jgi:hypothetical protein